MQKSQRTRGILLAGLIGLAACGGGEEEQETAINADTATAPTSAAAPAGALGDPQIAAILAASDSSEIQPSQLALQKAQNAQVKEFAQRMVTDHGALSDSLRAMAQQNNITPAPNEMSQQMQTQTQTVMQSLQGLSGAAFDSVYVQAMVQSHQAALNAVESQLIPAAQNPQLRTALEQKVRPAVSMHLQQIQQIQGTLGSR